MERDRTNIVRQSDIKNFNSHAHVERDAAAVIPFETFADFNSHAHVERDHFAPNEHPKPTISTHTLTWSVTHLDRKSHTELKISTHTLTWSVTEIVEQGRNLWNDFNSHAHVERDRSSTVISYCNSNFNSHAHVERDTAEIKLDGDNAISTHTLTWSVTILPSRLALSPYFNSHAHVERDPLNPLLQNVTHISTHTLTWSVTRSLKNFKPGEIFQLTRSRGA